MEKGNALSGLNTWLAMHLVVTVIPIVTTAEKNLLAIRSYQELDLQRAN